jgi:hypothetical protein
MPYQNSVFAVYAYIASRALKVKYSPNLKLCHLLFGLPAKVFIKKSNDDILGVCSFWDGVFGIKTMFKAFPHMKVSLDTGFDKV